MICCKCLLCNGLWCVLLVFCFVKSSLNELPCQHFVSFLQFCVANLRAAGVRGIEALVWVGVRRMCGDVACCGSTRIAVF